MTDKKFDPETAAAIDLLQNARHKSLPHRRQAPVSEPGPLGTGRFATGCPACTGAQASLHLTS